MRISDWSSDVCSSDLWFNGAVGGGLAGVAVQLYRNAIEQAKPDAERESGFQDRDAPRMEGRLKSMDKRYRSEEHTSELQSLMRISYAVFCLKKKKTTTKSSPHTL